MALSISPIGSGTSSSSKPGANGISQIAALQKQLIALQKQLALAVASGDNSPTSQAQTQMLSQEIQMVQSQIAQLQQSAAAVAQLPKAAAAETAQAQAESAEKAKAAAAASGVGTQVDVYA